MIYIFSLNSPPPSSSVLLISTQFPLFPPPSIASCFQLPFVQQGYHHWIVRLFANYICLELIRRFQISG